MTALMRAAYLGGNLDITKALLDRGVNVNDTDDQTGGTPLYWATLSGRKEVVELLIKARAKVNVKDKDGWTLLHWAAFKRYKEIAELLINAGADMKAEEKTYNWTPLDVAMRENPDNSHAAIIALLTSKRAI